MRLVTAEGRDALAQEKSDTLAQEEEDALAQEEEDALAQEKSDTLAQEEEDALGPCTCGACDCQEAATTRDDTGAPVCEDCSSYLVTASGDVVCSRMTAGWTRCHVCNAEIRWSCIQTGNPGSGEPNYRTGACDCGEAWSEEERGSWGNYAYELPAEDPEVSS